METKEQEKASAAIAATGSGGGAIPRTRRLIGVLVGLAAIVAVVAGGVVAVPRPGHAGVAPVLAADRAG